MFANCEEWLASCEDHEDRGDVSDAKSEAKPRIITDDDLATMNALSRDLL